jgi:hypothetical protein
MSAKYLRDATERVLATFVVAFIGLLTTALVPWLADQVRQIASGHWTWEGLLAACAVAGVIAAVDVVKVLAARFRGDDDSASLLKQ